jgi:hypothetical protein
MGIDPATDEEVGDTSKTTACLRGERWQSVRTPSNRENTPMHDHIAVLREGPRFVVAFSFSGPMANSDVGDGRQMEKQDAKTTSLSTSRIFWKEERG